MKPLRLLTTFVFLFLSVCSAMAQWAGEDQVLMRTSDSMEVFIGVENYNPLEVNATYEWVGPGIQSNNTLPQIRIRPHDGENEYRVRRVDSCGVSEEKVIITVVDTISIVSVTPKGCFIKGDTITKEDFIIVTVPAGFEDFVKISPNVAQIQPVLPLSGDVPFVNDVGYEGEISNPFVQHATQELTFSLTRGGHTTTKKVEVEVYKDEPANSFSINVNTLGFYRMIEQAKAKAQEIDDIIELIKKYSPPGLNPCDADLNISADIPLPLFFKSCCGGEEVDAYNLSAPNMTFAIKAECDFPLTTVVPMLPPNIKMNIGAQMGINIKKFELKYRGWECSRLEVPMEAFLEFYGGPKIEFLGDALEASGKCVAHFSLPGAIVINKEGVKWDNRLKNGIPVNFSVVFDITAKSLASFQWILDMGSVTLFSKTARENNNNNN